MLYNRIKKGTLLGGWGSQISVSCKKIGGLRCAETPYIQTYIQAYIRGIFSSILCIFRLTSLYIEVSYLYIWVYTEVYMWFDLFCGCLGVYSLFYGVFGSF